MKNLGDLTISKFSFPKVDALLKEFKTAAFKKLPLQKKLDRVCRVLLDQITLAKEGTFVLIPALDFIERVHKEKIIDHFHFNNFELWLNQFSNLSSAENMKVRGKLAGRYVPRETYQSLFPIGMGKMYSGSHFVTAHSSPDLDTTVASFWGWVDAFAARVSKGLHVWNVPGGEPPALVETALLFFNIFGDEVFELLAKHRTALTVSGLDLVTQEGVVHKSPQDSVMDIDPDQGVNAVVMIDENGGYLGEWRSTDVDRVRSVINLLSQCLRWYENTLHVKLIALFAKEKLSQKELQDFFHVMLKMTIDECDPAKEFTSIQEEAIDDFLIKVLNVSKGSNSTFTQFAQALAKFDLFQFEEFAKLSLQTKTVFDAKGQVTSDRTKLFGYLTKVISALEKAIYAIRLYVDKLSVALEVKSEVLGLSPEHVNYRADLDEIRSKIASQPYLTVTASDRHGGLFPMGVIHATELFKSSLGTVTLRDFSNREETKIPPYLEIISILDHHKGQISTSLPPALWITDSQSSNSLVAKISFAISDPFSTGGMTREEIASQIKEVQKDLKSASSKRILQRLLQRQLVSDHKTPYFVAPERETVEYLQCLYAILDDTDLLSKVSVRDVECVAEILNRLKSLSLRKEVEIIQFDDMHRDESFAKKAAARILQNDDMYSLYSKIYIAKEKSVDENLKLGAAGKLSNLFADTKEQNGCCRVGQTKLFSKNFSTFTKVAVALREKWLEKATRVHKEHAEIDFHLHMISTIPGAKELYSGKSEGYPHQDEIWFWIPSTDVAIEHFKNFLSAFKTAPQVENNPMEVEFLGENAKELQQIFKESFKAIPSKITKGKVPIAVLRVKAGSLNSRKAMISPYLPTIL
ncbi:MAG: hypothetical protein ABSA17_04330 [Rhabdochlamydiaceae bacterium]